jgi:hypothetical protein
MSWASERRGMECCQCQSIGKMSAESQIKSAEFPRVNPRGSAVLGRVGKSQPVPEPGRPSGPNTWVDPIPVRNPRYSMVSRSQRAPDSRAAGGGEIEFSTANEVREDLVQCLMPSARRRVWAGGHAHKPRLNEVSSQTGCARSSSHEEAHAMLLQ